MPVDAVGWVVRVFRPDGRTPRATYGSTDSEVSVVERVNAATLGTATVTPELAYFDQFSSRTTPTGDCLDASFVADWTNNIVSIHARDVVSINRNTLEEPTVYRPVFRGVAVMPRNDARRDHQPHAYRLLGLSSVVRRARTYKNRPWPAGMDILDLINKYMIENYALNSTTRGRVRFGEDGQYINLSGFPITFVPTPALLPGGVWWSPQDPLGVVTQAAVNAGAATVGEFLDSLVSLARAGGTETEWGVDATGLLFLRPVEGTLATFDLSTVGVMLPSGAAPDVQAEDVIARVQWVIADGTAQHRALYTPRVNRVALPTFRIIREPELTSLDTPDTLTFTAQPAFTDLEDLTVPLSPPSGVEVFQQVPRDWLRVTRLSGAPVSSWVGDEQDKVLLDLTGGSPLEGFYYDTGDGLPLAEPLTNAIPSGATIWYTRYHQPDPEGDVLPMTHWRLILNKTANVGATKLFGWLKNISQDAQPMQTPMVASVLDRMWDGDSISYAVLATDNDLALEVDVEVQGGVAVSTRLSENDVVKFRLNVRSDESSPPVRDGTVGSFGAYLQLQADPDTAIRTHALLEPSGSPISGETELVFGDRARGLHEERVEYGAGNVVRLALNFTNGTISGSQQPVNYAVQDWRAFTLNTELLEGLAVQETRRPLIEPVVLRVPGVVTGVGRLKLTESFPGASSAVTIADGDTVTTLEHRLSRQRGSETLISTGERTLDMEATSAAKGVRDLVRRASLGAAS